MKRPRILIVATAALVALNAVLAVHVVHAAEEDSGTRRRCRYQEHPSTGTMGEYCLDSCYFCHCGGSC